MTPEQFRDGYTKSSTWADLEKCYEQLSTHQIADLIKAFEITKAYTGLDMRQDFLLGLLRSHLKRVKTLE